MNTMNNEHPLGLSKLPAVEAMTGLKRSSIYARMNRSAKQYDPYFPHPISLSSTGGRGGVAWLTVEVIAWVERRINASRRQNGYLG